MRIDYNYYFRKRIFTFWMENHIIINSFSILVNYFVLIEGHLFFICRPTIETDNRSRSIVNAIEISMTDRF